MAKIRKRNPLRFVFLSNFFRTELMNDVIRHSEAHGFGSATFVDGSFRGNVKTVFFNRKQHAQSGSLKEVFDRIIEGAGPASKLFEIDTLPRKLEFMQVARYLPGDHYGQHIDHDSSLKNLEIDRKLSFFASCTNNGVLEVDGSYVNVGCGDAVIFPSTMYHAAPQQQEGSRYSFVAWIPGPNWR